MTDLNFTLGERVQSIYGDERVPGVITRIFDKDADGQVIVELNGGRLYDRDELARVPPPATDTPTVTPDDDTPVNSHMVITWRINGRWYLVAMHSMGLDPTEYDLTDVPDWTVSCKDWRTAVETIKRRNNPVATTTEVAARLIAELGGSLAYYTPEYPNGYEYVWYPDYKAQMPRTCEVCDRKIDETDREVLCCQCFHEFVDTGIRSGQ